MKLTLRKHTAIDYPSGSALEYDKGMLYVIGDDTHEVLCLDADWNAIKRIELFPYNGPRIPKPEKPDLECAAIAGDKLYILGSGSVSPQRDVAFIVDLHEDSVKRANTSAFYGLFRDRHLIPEMNIEGLTICRDKVLFFNRANTSHGNHLIITDQKILTKRFPDRFKVMPVHIPDLKGIPLGISGAAYDAARDILILSASAENTDNAYDDGEVLGSVLAMVRDITQKLDEPVLTVEELLVLDGPGFNRQKIESVCITRVSGNSYDLVLVADNDQGNSVLFDVQLDC